MFVLGVTGGIGSGKSAATEIFSSLGIKIVDADVLSRVPVQKGESGLLEIEKRYGKEILLSSGDLDRKKLRKIFFEKLGNLLHLRKLFLVILPFRRIIGILFLYKFLYIFGHISESTNNAICGFQYLMNLLVK